MNTAIIILAAGGLLASLVCVAWAFYLQENIWLRHRTRAKQLFVAAFGFLILSLGLLGLYATGLK